MQPTYDREALTDLATQDNALAAGTPTAPLMPHNIFHEPSASYWLLGALRGALERDPVDALHDAEALVEALRNHADAILKAEVDEAAWREKLAHIRAHGRS